MARRKQETVGVIIKQHAMTASDTGVCAHRVQAMRGSAVRNSCRNMAHASRSAPVHHQNDVHQNADILKSRCKSKSNNNWMSCAAMDLKP